MVAAVDDVTEAMKDVVDPELGINVVDLGLIYDVMVDENNIAVLNMTLTSAACPLQDVIEDQTRQALAPLTSDVKINWVWMPPGVQIRSLMTVANNFARWALQSKFLFDRSLKCPCMLAGWRYEL